MFKLSRRVGAGVLALACGWGSAQAIAEHPAGTSNEPLRVMLIPADTGADTTKNDFQPIFNAITDNYGLHFDLRVGSSYAAVVEGMESGVVDVAFLGAVTLHQAKERDAAELLAVSVKKGSSSYYSGLFVRKDSGITTLDGLKGKAVSFGDVNSTSSFNFPVAMLLAGGVDPVKDLSMVYITGSHSNSIAALVEGQVDACACSFNAYEKAVKNGVVDPAVIVPLMKSDPIPNPPLAMHPNLDPKVKATLVKAFENIHETPGVTPEMIRGYGGKKYDRYDTTFPQAAFDEAMTKLAAVTDQLKAEMLEKAGNN
ncbi:MAG: phosphate/phosphite/phosphonate ABC transporter substrate-binding protein [Planctomycetota bacterium]